MQPRVYQRAVVRHRHRRPEVRGVQARPFAVGGNGGGTVRLYGHTTRHRAAGNEACRVAGVGVARKGVAVAVHVLCDAVDGEHHRGRTCRLPLQAHRVGPVLGHPQPPGRTRLRREVYVVDEELSVVERYQRPTSQGHTRPDWHGAEVDGRKVPFEVAHGVLALQQGEGAAVSGIGQVAYIDARGAVVGTPPEEHPHPLGAIVHTLVGHQGEACLVVVAQRLGAAVGYGAAVEHTHIVVVQVGQRPPPRRAPVGRRTLEVVADVHLAAHAKRHSQQQQQRQYNPQSVGHGIFTTP